METVDRLPCHGILVFANDQHPIFDPGLDDFPGLGFGLVGGVSKDDPPRGSSDRPP
jgi:hypothetical protein